jgi:hypothetical protein
MNAIKWIAVATLASASTLGCAADDVTTLESSETTSSQQTGLAFTCPSPPCGPPSCARQCDSAYADCMFGPVFTPPRTCDVRKQICDWSCEVWGTKGGAIP